MKTYAYAIFNNTSNMNVFCTFRRLRVWNVTFTYKLDACTIHVSANSLSARHRFRETGVTNPLSRHSAHVRRDLIVRILGIKSGVLEPVVTIVNITRTRFFRRINTHEHFRTDNKTWRHDIYIFTCWNALFWLNKKNTFIHES